MADNRLPKQILTWMLEGRNRRESPEMKWEKEVGKSNEAKNITTEGTVKWQIW